MSARAYSRIECALALTIAIALALALGVLLLASPIKTYFAQDALIDKTSERLRAFAARARNLPALELARDALEDHDLRAQGLITAETEELAAAELQTIIREIAARANGAIATIRTEAGGDAPNLTTVLAQMTLPTETLPAFLTELENARPLVFVEMLELRSDHARSARDAAPESLYAQLRVAAYFAPGTADP